MTRNELIASLVPHALARRDDPPRHRQGQRTEGASVSEIKAKAQMDWTCPYCGLFGKGTLNMNGKAMEWLDAAWKAHIHACRVAAAKVSP